MKKTLTILLCTFGLLVNAEQVKMALLQPRVAEGSDACRPIELNMVRGELLKAFGWQSDFQVLTRTDVDQMLKELGFQQSGMVDDNQRRKVGEMSGAQYICVSSLTKEGTQLYIEAYLVDVETGQMTNPATKFAKVQDNDYGTLQEPCNALAREMLGELGGGSSTNFTPFYNSSANQDFTKEISGENVKKILVTPENATIFINDQEVGNGSYIYKFDEKTDFIKIKFTAPGYITKTVKLMKDNPKQTISYTLYEDEAYKNSVGSDADIANKWITITCKKGMTKDKVWHDLMGVVSSYFKYFEERDKTAGLIKTAWHTTTFYTGPVVRTRLEIRMMVGGEDENELSYKIRISSEIKDSDCFGDQCYEKYPRVLRKFNNVINDLQSSLDANTYN